MNKVRLILKYQGIKENQEKKRLPSTLDVNDVLEDLSNFDPFVDYIPEVPEYVKEWYHDVQSDFYTSLELLVQHAGNNRIMPICDWFMKTPDALRILVNMHQFGYKRTEGKKYTVAMLGLLNSECYLIKHNGVYLFGSKASDGSDEHTREELEEHGFHLLFNNPMFQIEEV